MYNSSAILTTLTQKDQKLGQINPYSQHCKNRYGIWKKDRYLSEISKFEPLITYLTIYLLGTIRIYGVTTGRYNLLISYRKGEVVMNKLNSQ